MIRVALGQSKMTRRPIAGILHILIYVGFVIINIEMIEIIIRWNFWNTSIFHIIPLSIYNFLIASFEFLAFLVLLPVLFLSRRNVVKLKRFWSKEMTAWPRTDANLILILSFLMVAFLFMDAADMMIQISDNKKKLDLFLLVILLFLYYLAYDAISIVFH